MPDGFPLPEIAILLGGCEMDTKEAPQFLLIFREWLRRGSDEAYDVNESQLAAVSAAMKCRHPYLALVSMASPGEVWWFNAFASQDEKDDLEAAYARNEPLMDAMRPLGKRKEDFRETSTSIMTEYRPELSGGAVLRIDGARFFVINTSPNEGESTGAVFESCDGQRFGIASAYDAATAEQIARRSGPSAVILRVKPQWSFPDASWIDADPAFWDSNPAARRRIDGRDSM
jgi:hypothetical protein